MRQGWEEGVFSNPDPELVEGEGTLLALWARANKNNKGETIEG